jgi:hypothetical protein
MSKPTCSFDAVSRLKRQLLVTGTACLVLFTAPVGLADQSDKTKSPDTNVLEDLGADLFDDKPGQLNAAEQGVPGRLNGKHSGEDVKERQSAADRDAGLKFVLRQMNNAASLLTAKNTSGEASTTQQEVVNELDAMIAKLQKQCESCGGQCSKPPGPSTKPPKPGGKSSSKPGEAPGTAATQTAAPIDRSAIGNLVKDLWGRLPERQREELLQPLSEEFLPEYAAEIEEYFRVLAETPGDHAAEKQP